MNTKLQAVIKELMTNSEKLFLENQEKDAEIQRIQSDSAQNGNISEETLDELKNNYVQIVKDKDNQLENQKELTRLQTALVEKKSEENKKLKAQMEEQQNKAKDSLKKCIEKA